MGFYSTKKHLDRLLSFQMPDTINITRSGKYNSAPKRFHLLWHNTAYLRFLCSSNNNSNGPYKFSQQTHKWPRSFVCNERHMVDLSNDYFYLFNVNNSTNEIIKKKYMLCLIKTKCDEIQSNEHVICICAYDKSIHTKHSNSI